jgi:putative transcriptional regulator
MTPRPRHHLDPATVVSYTAGALSPEMSAVVATHLEGCAHCRRTVARAEGIGGALVDQQQASAVRADRLAGLRAAMLEGLAQAGPPGHPPAPAPAPAANDPDRLPTPLQPYFGASYRALKWRWMGPGMHYIQRRGAGGQTLLMLRIAPGKSLPVHGHGGTEITQILRGAYDDALGHFGPGDVADLDADTEHQPVTAPGVPCICVAAMDAPLRFPGWVARTLQPVFGI